jgi:hypothetical protein
LYVQSSGKKTVTNMSDKPLALAHIVNPVKVGTQSDATRRRGLALRLKSLLNDWRRS